MIHGDASEDQIRRELATGEVLRWSGRPQQGVRFVPADLFLVPFSLMWGGFAIFWEASVFATDAPFFFKLWGIPFVLVGIYLIVGRFLHDAWKRARIHYGVTDRRILILSVGSSRTVRSIDPRSCGEVEVRERSDGSGTIRFGSAVGAMTVLAQSNWPGAAKAWIPAFEGIPDVRDVKARIDAVGKG